MTLGEQIQARRKEAGISQEELGERLGVARQSVSKWESGSTVPELEKLIAMSKLFGVSVGNLLGLEESDGTNQELTEREWKALEAIARRLVPPAQEPRKRKRWPYVAAALAVTVAGAALMSRVRDLENQIGGLHYNISNIDNTVSRQISSLTGQVREILEEQNNVIAQKDHRIAGMDLTAGTVTFDLSATPREYREGMTAVFSATGPEFEPVEIQGALDGGQTFTAKLVCPLTDDITLSVGFRENGSTVTQQLVQETYLYTNTLVSVRGNLSWSVIHGDGERKSRVESMEATMWMGQEGSYWTAKGWKELTAVRGTLRLWKGEELLWSQGDIKFSHDQSGDDRYPILVEELELAPGEQVLLSLLYTDTAGREEETFLDGFRIDEAGKPEQLASYEEEAAFPWK